MKKILFLAPIPPPYNGHSLMSQYLLDLLRKRFKIILVNLNKKSMIEGNISTFRVYQILKVFFISFFNQWRVDFVYFTISESIAGNIKDMLIYLLLFFKLNRFILHLHGGSIEKDVFLKSKIIFSLNKFFLRRVKKIIVLSKSHKSYFESFMDPDKINVIPNFTQYDTDDLGVDLETKYSDLNVVNILFLSNMTPKKGYGYLLDAFLALDPEIRKQLKLNFAGRFEDKLSEIEFLKKIERFNNIHYHGEVYGKSKSMLLMEAHVFVLPSLHNEGQPLSILEAYTFGCIVVASDCPGILDICIDQENGFIIKRDNLNDFSSNLTNILSRKEDYFKIASFNRTFVTQNFNKELFKNNFLDSDIFLELH